MPYVVEAADKAGCHASMMAVAGGSAGGCPALIYAYRDAATSPVPVAMVFEAAGPSRFYPEDWRCCGFDQSGFEEAAAGLLSTMCGANRPQKEAGL